MSAPELLIISDNCGLGCDSKFLSTDALPPSPVPSAPHGQQAFAPTTPPRAPPCAAVSGSSASDTFSTQSKDEISTTGYENRHLEHSDSNNSRSSASSDAVQGDQQQCAMFDPPSPTSQSQSREIVFDLDDAAFCSDYFRMYEFKVKRCPRARPHDWTLCPFAHPGEKAKRRDPKRYKYTGTACPDFRKGFCKRGDNCTYSHGVFECWLHPARYRTQMCTDGAGCRRRVCFFAHYESEIRKAEDNPEVQNELLAAESVFKQPQQQDEIMSALSTLIAAQQSGRLNLGGAMQQNAYLEMLHGMANGSSAPGETDPVNQALSYQSLLSTLHQQQQQQQLQIAPHLQQLHLLHQQQAAMAAAELQLRLTMQQQQQQQQQASPHALLEPQGHAAPYLPPGLQPPSSTPPVAPHGPQHMNIPGSFNGLPRSPPPPPPEYNPGPMATDSYLQQGHQGNMYGLGSDVNRQHPGMWTRQSEPGSHLDPLQDQSGSLRNRMRRITWGTDHQFLPLDEAQAAAVQQSPAELTSQQKAMLMRTCSEKTRRTRPQFSFEPMASPDAMTLAHPMTNEDLLSQSFTGLAVDPETRGYAAPLQDPNLSMFPDQQSGVPHPFQDDGWTSSSAIGGSSIW